MTYRVINFDTGEIAAELGDYGLAVEMANRLAEQDNYTEIWGVAELVTRHVTSKPGAGDQSSN